MATIIEMPKLSDTMSVGTLVKWHKNIGDSVQNGDILAEVETDKATMELENFDDGTLIEIFVGEGEEVPVGSPLAAIGESGEKVDKPSNLSSFNKDSSIDDQESTTPSNSSANDSNDKKSNLKSPKSSDVSNSEKLNHDLQETGENRILISPLAKKIAFEKKVDVKEIIGSGPNGRITKNDVISFINESPSITPSPISSIKSNTVSDSLKNESVPVSKMRNIIATRLLESKTTIPHFYLQKEINSLPLNEARAALNLKLLRRSDETSLKLTLNDLILKACAETIKLVPEINSSWADTNINYHNSVNLAFGVAIDDGLVTPVIQNAQDLNLLNISQTAKELITKARSKKLSPDEMSGSTFTVTNLGMFGIDFFSGIINPPNAAILSVGASIKKPVVDGFNQIKAGETMMLGLSCDHRLVDGAIGARFLKELADILENPVTMLI